MLKKLILGALAFASLSFAQEPAKERKDATEGLTAPQILAQARDMLPRENLSLTGRLIVRRERGFINSERPFRLNLNWSGLNPTGECILYRSEKEKEQIQRAVLTRIANRKADIRIFDETDAESTVKPRFNMTVGETDMTWMDLSFDYLWWTDARIIGREDRILGSDCLLILAKPPLPIPGCSAVKLWVDRRVGFMIQVEHLGDDGQPVRRLWIQKLREMKERWMPRLMYAKTLGLSRMTEFWIDDLIVNGEIVQE